MLSPFMPFLKRLGAWLRKWGLYEQDSAIAGQALSR